MFYTYYFSSSFRLEKSGLKSKNLAIARYLVREHFLFASTRLTLCAGCLWTKSIVSGKNVNASSFLDSKNLG
jgi:hypothetical protein